MIIDCLIDKIKEMNNPTVVGLDPRLDYVPEFIKAEAFAQHGHTPAAAAAAFYKFNCGLIDSLWDIVPAVKPQVAMYEQYGPEGMAAYINTISYAKSKNMVVIGDVKRGDIASTAEAYSDGHIGEVKIGGEGFQVYKEDFITINPYLGFDSIEPYLPNCEKFDRGLFVLVKTSNPNSGEIQDLVADGEKIYQRVGKLVQGWGKNLVGKHGYSAVGAVVGATHKAQAAELRKLLPGVFFLVPGYGAQGGKAEDLAVCFDENKIGAIVNSSRGIIAAWQKSGSFSQQDFAAAARQAALDMRKDLRENCLS